MRISLSRYRFRSHQASLASPAFIICLLRRPWNNLSPTSANHPYKIGGGTITLSWGCHHRRSEDEDNYGIRSSSQLNHTRKVYPWSGFLKGLHEAPLHLLCYLFKQNEATFNIWSQWWPTTASTLLCREYVVHKFESAKTNAMYVCGMQPFDADDIMHGMIVTREGLECHHSVEFEY